MDGSLQQNDKLILDDHLNCCFECKKDFSIYTQILEDFSTDVNTLELDIPEDFEKSVMAKIQDIEPVYIEKKISSTNLIYLTAGFIGLLSTISIIMAINKSFIIEYMYKIPFFYNLLEFSEYIKGFSGSFVMTLKQIGDMLLNNLPTFLEGFKNSSLVVIVVLILAQFLTYNKEKINA